MAKNNRNTNDSVTASPLCWPIWKDRTPADARRRARFSQKSGSSYARPLTLAQARSRLLDEVRRFTGSTTVFDPSWVIISSDLALRKDGLPRSGAKKPEDPGVAVYFSVDGVPKVFPCDEYDRIEDNLAAIATTLNCLRTIKRHGGAESFNSAFTGFTALTGPDPVARPTWREVLNCQSNDLHEAKIAFLRRRKETHPDYGGSVEEFSAVLDAWEQCKQELGNVPG